MIINDTHEFVFVHIPKCAGTYVRDHLQPFDETGGEFTNRIDAHPELGMVDFVHLPLFVLRENFSAEHEKIRRYKSFAVVRNPHDRFSSSVAQFLKKQNCPIQNHTHRKLQEEIEKVMHFLRLRCSQKENLLPPDYIHFQPQHDYIYDRGECLIDKLYSTENVNMLLRDLEELIGEKLVAQSAGDWKRPGQSVLYRNCILRTFIEAVRPALDKTITPMLSDKAKNKIRKLVYTTNRRRLTDLFSSTEITAFVNEFYRDDIALYNRVRSSEKN